MASIADLFKTDKAEGLSELFIAQLKDIYWAENKLTEALPEMEAAATSDELKNGIRKHLAETEGQIARLEQIFTSIGVEAEGVKCEAMAGLVEEGQDIVAETQSGTLTRDAGIIAACQKVEHYEIASYGTLTAWAKILGYEEAARLLHATLQEEEATDVKLTNLAETFINASALIEN
ncbi:ferritin-like domain-containing protein [Siphonobacter sp. SORGH_AS_0500]|uniref:YciE/YciF ferroxidase family protein n=1 Tax=Siphonobacter sp. SORGH_AS_0500 TaxID=1864824 RepID=UPI00285C5F45|nr:ferritin-like domain-containing protein [Siphonobacter sp. SORGH_AS_0500]MDR6195680.1 ferritin-like metal-binding protein YciE [Siphonobacter sp. SORGH_AS_0500]